MIKILKNLTNLGSFARKINVLPSGIVKLKTLAQVVLKEDLCKDDNIRLSNWSCSDLAEEEISCACLDAAKSLETCNKIQNLPVLSLRLNKMSCLPGMIVDIFHCTVALSQ